jgi:hypothetical protein
LPSHCYLHTTNSERRTGTGPEAQRILSADKKKGPRERGPSSGRKSPKDLRRRTEYRSCAARECSQETLKIQLKR